MTGRRQHSAANGPGLSRIRWLAALGLIALVGALYVALSSGPAQAQDSEEFRFRIAVRLSEDSPRLEFGIQRLDADGRPRLMQLERRRFFPLAAGHHRWLRGDSAFLVQAPYYDAPDLETIGYPPGVQGVDVKVVARLHPTRAQVEFGATYELDASQLPNSVNDAFVDPVFPERRFFPSQVGHHRWLYSSTIRFTRVWAGDGMMGAEATLENEAPESEPEPAAEAEPTTDSCLAIVERHIEAMVSGPCHALLTAYCEEHPSHAWCVRRREES